MLEKMDVVEEVLADPTLIIKFPDPEPLVPPILQFQDVSFGYSKDKMLFKNLNLGIDLDSRVALVGANGFHPHLLSHFKRGWKINIIKSFGWPNGSCYWLCCSKSQTQICSIQSALC
jgi:hypothetical protein